MAFMPIPAFQLIADRVFSEANADYSEKNDDDDPPTKHDPKLHKKCLKCVVPAIRAIQCYVVSCSWRLLMRFAVVLPFTSPLGGQKELQEEDEETETTLWSMCVPNH